MEQLFGSLDYCECDHCRSVLSPAAYLVDLLQFLDPPADEWQAELALWATDHGAPYPFADAQAWQDFRISGHRPPDQPVPDTGFALPGADRRRPDLAELPLTCENTNTAMPYIDMVNEILEYYVAHGRLAPGRGARHRRRRCTADLLAEPQYLIPEAYDDAARARSYPLGLPFDLWLETVRRLLDHFDAPLWRVLDAFRRTDDAVPDRVAALRAAAVAIERLGLSGAEYAMLTDPDPEPHWHELYGYPADGAGQALAELTNAKTLARRLGVTYQELVDLMPHRLRQPAAGTLAALPKLGLGISDVLRYQGAPGHAPFTPDEQAAFEAALAPIGGPAALGDLGTPASSAQILVLADPDAGCGFETTTLQYADGRRPTRSRS